jgi:glycosyltransferase involved in cell wall biosynthesis
MASAWPFITLTLPALRCKNGRFGRSGAHRLKGRGSWPPTKVMRHLHVAVRDLDPPGGGAERSLAALLNGLAHAGPVASSLPQLVPTVPVDLPPTHEAWEIRAMCSEARGAAAGLLDLSVDLTRVPIPHEGPWSRVAWGLRQRSGERRPRPWAHRLHLKRRNAQFERVVSQWLPAEATGIGLTQLDWSPGAVAAFVKAGLPWVVFVRDEIVFRFPELYRPVLEGAALVCGAGEGLLAQVRSAFEVRATANVPLPIDFGGRFGPVEEVAMRVQTARAARGEGTRPRITVVGVTPEKGLATYHALLPRLSERWPEVEVEFVGDGAFIEELRRYPNAVLRGARPVEEVFPSTDVHLLLVETTGSWGRVINEAGLHRVPSVTCSIGSQPEAVGPGGLVVDDHRDIDALIDGLRHVLDERDLLGQRAFEHAAVVDHRRSIACFREALEGVLAR